MRARFLMISATVFGLAGPMAAVVAPTAAFAQTPVAVAVAPQYDTSHVYVAPADVERFVQSFTATFGGQSTPQVVVNVLPVPSSTTSQLIHPSGHCVAVRVHHADSAPVRSGA